MDQTFLDTVAEITKQAGRIVEDIAQSGFETSFKTGDDPVTTADHAANTYLQSHLLELLPEAGWLSEETRDTEDRLTKQYVWIVDPIDGTREFVERIPHYAVSVALAKDGEVILGVVYNPAKDECFYALVGEGAWLNGSPITAEYKMGLRESSSEVPRLVALGSRSEIKRGEFQPFEGLLEVEAVGSIAYKLALVAAGRAHTTFSLVPKNEWDLAGGVAIIHAAGGRATDKTGKPFAFNQRDTLTNGSLAATHADYDEVLQLIQRVG
ncbi:inositol phosphatase [Alicyclobacillus ferrooxydans]|uniref:inositol-phosphate phosphatase n=1 Tax=Alicyclobacillus ferrooxydans TaxID=471514 RepID=A0A0P9CZY3_9BACL|nr:inositol phosphatase [Alicyclobacillus ferrooxydans]